MDSKITTPAAPAAMLHNATIDKAEKSEFSNTARDTIKLMVNMNNYNFTKEGENLVFESSDVIDCLRNGVPLLLAEVRKNDQSRSTVSHMTGADSSSDPVPQANTADHTVEGDPVEVIDLVPSEASSLRVASVADRYTRSMLKCLAGYPLYEPQPFSELSREYLGYGVNVGDVGFVRGDGVFDFLFNMVSLSKQLIIRQQDPAEHFRARLAFSKVPLRERILRSGEYICEGPEGAILELPEGAIQEEATNIRPFAKLAACHGVRWYEYTMTRGREISNGSLYLITAITKCAQWGIAVFDRPCVPEQGLRFDKKRSFRLGKSASKYHWKGSRAYPTKVSDHNQGDSQNQCVFLRGYKIMIRQDIFDNLCNDQPHGSYPAIPSSSPQARSISMKRDRATRIRGGGGSDPISKKLTNGGLMSWTKMSSMTKSDEVVLHANFNSSLVHPSDFINGALLSQNLGAKIALTHDDVWCDLLQDNFPKLNYATLVNTARSYTNTVDEYDCITLEKISDLSTVLDESGYPLQGTKIPAIQVLLTTPPSPATISMTLPCELLERILLLLDPESTLTCRLVNREFNELIQSSTLLQYFLACKVAGVIDNPQSPLSYAERLEALRKHEDAWRKLKPVFETTINVNHQTVNRFCRSTEGVYFLGDNNLKDLNYCHLSSFSRDSPRWIRIPGHGPALNWSGTLVNFVAALREHDLLVNLISSDIGNQGDIQRHSLDLVLLKFSTGEYHPLARCPRIHVQRSPEVRPQVTANVVGNNLALVVHSRDGTFSDKLIIFDWKTGRKLLQHETTENAYSGLVFVSPELFLVPNRVLSHFEVWHLPLDQLTPKPPIQILSLQIPIVSTEFSLTYFSCRGEPNPFLHSMPYLPPHPFFSSTENSIIISKLRISSSSRRRVSYNLVMHRRALLDTIQTWTSTSLLEQEEYLSMWLTNEVTVHNVADSEDESVEMGAQSKLVSTTAHPRRTRDFPNFESFPTAHISAVSGPSSVSSGLSTKSSTSRCTFFQVPWEKWGPSISRWFQVNENQGWSLFFSNGQRYAFSDPNPLDGKKLMVTVVDFNQHNYRRNAGMMARVRSEGKGEGEEGEFETLDHKGVFSEEVYMGLKCVVYHAPDEYDFDLVEMDEHRLLGVKLNRAGLHESIKVLHIG